MPVLSKSQLDAGVVVRTSVLGRGPVSLIPPE